MARIMCYWSLIYFQCVMQNVKLSPQHYPHSDDVLALGHGCSGQRVF